MTISDFWMMRIIRNPFKIKKLCLGIGRFPIRTVEQATQMVDKVISYMENKNTGSWKNNLCFMADDGSNTDGFMTEHMEFADQLAGYVESEHPEFLVNKLYYDAYKKTWQQELIRM